MLSDRRRTYLNYLFENMTYLYDFDGRTTNWTKTINVDRGVNEVLVDVPILNVNNGFDLSSYNRLLFMTDSNLINGYSPTSNAFHVFTARRNEDFKSVAQTLRLFICKATIDYASGGSGSPSSFINSIKFNENGLYVTSAVDGSSKGDIIVSVYLGNPGLSTGSDSVNHLTIFGINE